MAVTAVRVHVASRTKLNARIGIVESGQASEQGMQISCERTAKVMFAASSDTAYRRLTMVSALYTRPRQ